MKDFKKSVGFKERGERSSGFGRPSFGGSSRGFSRPPSGFKKSDMHDATCSKCNKKCSVPFLPNGKKPVFCNDCHVSADSPRENSRDTGRSSFPRKEFTPRSFAPAGAGSDDTARQLAALNKKFDVLIEKIDALLND